MNVSMIMSNTDSSGGIHDKDGEGSKWAGCLPWINSF
jgi:hypothetical protein